MNKKFYKYEHIFFLYYINGESKTYTYDAEGNRTRKVVEKGYITETRYYIGNYEIFRKETSGVVDYERKTLNINDDEKVFVRIEQKTDENEVVRYQYDNHLGSACLELDTAGQIISYEEYHPFGTTSYRSGRSETEVSLKRYKYNGKERDEETGLYYYGMRYYAAWLCRFVSCDPLQFEYPHYTPYQYAGNQPITYIDLDGVEPANNPTTAGINEKKAMKIVNLIEAAAAKRTAEKNFFSRSSWLAEDSQLKGKFSEWGNGDYITDTTGDSENKFNAKVNDALIFNVDESQKSHTWDYEAFVVYRLLNNFVTGKGPENYNFPVNGIISSKFLESDIFKYALAAFNEGEDVLNQQFQFKGRELFNDVMKTGTIFSITGFTGSASITMTKTDEGVSVQIFNITSLYSGDLLKDAADKLEKDKDANSAKSYVRDPDKTTPYGNISQTYNLFIPNDSPLLKQKQ